jgi:hypothetical protein
MGAAEITVLISNGDRYTEVNVSWTHRLTARLQASQLDRMLADGKPPDSTVLLALHARRLYALPARRQLARSLRQILSQSMENRSGSMIRSDLHHSGQPRTVLGCLVPLAFGKRYGLTAAPTPRHSTRAGRWPHADPQLSLPILLVSRPAPRCQPLLQLSPGYPLVASRTGLGVSGLPVEPRVPIIPHITRLAQYRGFVAPTYIGVC